MLLPGSHSAVQSASWIQHGLDAAACGVFRQFLLFLFPQLRRGFLGFRCVEKQASAKHPNSMAEE